MPRVMEISTPLGADVLLFHRMRAHEELGRLSVFDIEMLSKDGAIGMDKILGKSVTVTLMLADDKPRHFTGYVTRFAQQGTIGRYHRYAATVRPWLWFLTRTADCRIFQEMTVPDILKKVLGECDTSDVKFDLTGSYRKWTYCVQYRETDFNFVSRLMETEGIYYYFKHGAGKNTLVVTDSISGHGPFPGTSTIRFIAPDQLVRPELEHIRSWDFAREVQPGAYVHDDYDFERPSVELRSNKSVPRGYSPSSAEIYDYPGYYTQKNPDGEAYADVRIHEFSAQFEKSRAVTNARGAATGCLFTLDGFSRGDQNREHLIVSANHELLFSQYEAMPAAATGPAEYSCDFVAMSSAEIFRPERTTRKPFVQGPQTAIVVGPGGDEIYTDKYGRVKVQFHWDRLGKKDENSSCWVRVSQPWAGKNWGAIAIPRIGQEVIVDFLEGDPDQPIITGRVYNAEQTVPYALPANKTQTGIKSRSSLSGGPDNFNEIRFEDKKGEEQVFIHAEKNQDIEVENDETHWVGHDRKKTIDHDETTHVKHDRTETVDNDETITVHANRSETVDKDETITIHGNRSELVDKNESVTISGNRTENVAKNKSTTIDKNRTASVGENETIDVGKDQTTNIANNRTLSVGKKETITVSDSRSDEVAKNRDTSVGENDSLQVGKKLVLDAGEQITIRTGSASITMKKDGTITIAGKDITLQGSGKINIKASSDVVIKGSKVTQN